MNPLDVYGIGEEFGKLKMDVKLPATQPPGDSASNQKHKKPKGAKYRLCPVVCCDGCRKHNVTLYNYEDMKLCKACKTRLEKSGH